MEMTNSPHRPSDSPSLKVLLIDRDGRRCRDRLTALAKSGRVQAAEAAETIEAWLARADRIEPEVVVMSADTSSEREISDSAVALERLRLGARLLLADVPGEDRPPLALSAWGQVPEGAPFVALLECICRVASGQVTLSSEQLGEVMRRLQELIRLGPSSPSAVGAPARSRLTAREREVLGLMADRLSNREIAAALCLEIGTVKNHVHSVLRKLGLQNRHQAVYFRSRQVAPTPDQPWQPRP